MVKPLSRIPVEVLENIASFLPTPAFNNMRLTCREMQNKLFESWSNAFFRKKQFMISHKSLEALFHISWHETLRYCLNHLIIGLDHLAMISRPPLPALFHTAGCPSTEEHLEHQRLANAQDYLVDTGRASHIIGTAIAKLPNLESVELRNWYSRTRYRDNGLWASYGYSESPVWAYYIRSCDGRTPLADFDSSRDFVRCIFKSVLFGLSDCVNAESVFTLKLQGPYGGRYDLPLNDSAFALCPDPDDMEYIAVSDSITRLTTLKLNVDLQRDVPPELQLRPEGASDVPTTAAQAFDPASANLRKFLSLAPNLVWLGLAFAGDTAPGIRFLTWLSLSEEDIPAGGWTDANPKPIAPPLHRLDVSSTHVTPGTMARIFNKFDELRVCSLVHMLLLDDDHEAQGTSDGEADDFGSHGSGTRWNGVLHNALTLRPELEILHLHTLWEMSRTYGAEDQVWFVERAEQLAVDGWKAPNTKVEAMLSPVNRLALDALAKRTWLRNKLQRAVPRLRLNNVPTTSMIRRADNVEDTDDMDM